MGGIEPPTGMIVWLRWKLACEFEQLTCEPSELRPLPWQVAWRDREGVNHVCGRTPASCSRSILTGQPLGSRVSVLPSSHSMTVCAVVVSSKSQAHW